MAYFPQATSGADQPSVTSAGKEETNPKTKTITTKNGLEITVTDLGLGGAANIKYSRQVELKKRMWGSYYGKTVKRRK